jgi:hypothetical protein
MFEDFAAKLGSEIEEAIVLFPFYYLPIAKSTFCPTNPTGTAVPSPPATFIAFCAI